MMNTKRIEWIDVARVVAMLLVIYGHCLYYTLLTDFGGIDYSPESNSYALMFRILSRLCGFVYSFHMPLFMMISGMCYTFTAKKLMTWHSFIYDKFVRLVIPFFLVTFFLSVPLKWLSGYWDNSSSILSDIVFGQYILMGNSHLWFVVSLFWIFICARILITWQEHIGKCYHFFAISALVLLNLLSEFLQYDYFGILNAMQYLLYFYIGYYLLPIIDKWNKLSIPFILFSFVMWFVFQTVHNRFALAYESVPGIHTFNSFMYIIGAVGASISCCLLCKHLNQKGIEGGVFRNNTYELYLYSDPFNYLIIFICWKIFGEMIFVNNLTAVSMVIIRFVGTILFAFLIIYVVRWLRIKELGRQLLS